MITVGATKDQGTIGLGDDVIAPFSAYGVTPEGFAKPDLVAPGIILSACWANQMPCWPNNIPASQLLWSGPTPVAWNSVSWNSVSWNSDYWEP